MPKYQVLLYCFWYLACADPQSRPPAAAASLPAATIAVEPDPIREFFQQHPEAWADGFDFPVGKPNAKGYYNAQPFTRNRHLGDDWNAVTGGNSDLGDPIYAIANGLVVSAAHAGPGWGQVVRVVHFHEVLRPQYVESVYAHCDRMLVQAGDQVQKGAQIATIGNADGVYYAHLHLEIRDSVGMELGGGYSTDTTGYRDPTAFIRSYRAIP